MGRLTTRVREAEERLAGLASALQSAYEEEHREAEFAREAARVSLARAEAMAQAARALGRDELGQRLREVIDHLRQSETDARARLAELATVEETIRARLDGTSAPAAPALPAPPPLVEAAPSVPATTVPAAVVPATTVPAAVVPATPATAAPAAGSSKVAELRQKLAQLGVRIAEIEKSAVRLPASVLRLALEEHLALVRLLGQRFDEADAEGTREVEPLVARLVAVGAKAAFPPLNGASPDDFDDWAKVAADARSRRQALAPKPRA